jgi:hypothetical protein
VRVREAAHRAVMTTARMTVWGLIRRTSRSNPGLREVFSFVSSCSS